MCAERLGQFVTLALVLAAFDPARGTDATNPPDGLQDRGSQQKGRLSLQNTGKHMSPRGGGLLGDHAGYPCSAPREFHPELGAHLGPCKLLGWSGTCKGEREAKRGPRLALCARNLHVLAG